MFNVTFLHFDEANRPYDSTVDISFVPESLAFDSYEEAASLLRCMGYKPSPALNLWSCHMDAPLGTNSFTCHALISKITSARTYEPQEFCRTECHISTEGHRECAF